MYPGVVKDDGEVLRVGHPRRGQDDILMILEAKEWLSGSGIHFQGVKLGVAHRFAGVSDPEILCSHTREL